MPQIKTIFPKMHAQNAPFIAKIRNFSSDIKNRVQPLRVVIKSCATRRFIVE